MIKVNKKLIRSYKIFALAIFSFAAFAGVTTLVSAAPNDPNAHCIKQSDFNHSVTKNANSVTGKFKIPPNCKSQVITLAVYEVRNGNWQQTRNNQFLFASRAVNAKPGTGVHTLTVSIPNCAWQADLLVGKAANIAAGQQQSPRLASAVGNVGEPCKKTPPPPVDECDKPNPPAKCNPNPGNGGGNGNGGNNGNNNQNGNTNNNNNSNTNNNTNTNTNTNTNNNTNTVNVTTTGATTTGTDGTSTSESTSSTSTASGDQEVAAVAETSTTSDAKELPNTGPGQVIASVMGISTLSGLIYPAVARRFGL